jgi:predicted lactoylglutathione lyase
MSGGLNVRTSSIRNLRSNLGCRSHARACLCVCDARFGARSRKGPDIQLGISVSKHVFINLPVVDLSKSIAFFEALGFSQNPQFTDDAGACIVVSDTISLMLLTHVRFRDFTPKAICDTSKAVEVLLNLSCESRDEVDGLVAKAIAAGGSTYDEPEDYGFMYTHSFLDLDGHGWGLFHMSLK